MSIRPALLLLSAAMSTACVSGQVEEHVSPPCGAASPAQLASCYDPVAYKADVTFVGKPREHHSAHWQAVQDLGFDRLSELGFEVERQVYDTGVNVIGTKKGARSPGEQVIVSAHYDHIPGCPGADDNATGVAAVMEIARILSTR